MAVDGLQRMESDLERVIEKDEDVIQRSSISPGGASAGDQDLRTRLDHLIHSHRFMVGVIVLVILDCVMVVAELLFDLEIVKLGEEHHFVPHIFHYCSLAILSLFLIEVGIRIFVLRLDFFKHKLELFDAVVVVVSWVLDIVFRNNEDAAAGVGLLIILRLWRITRVINGIVLSVQKQAEQKIEKEKHLREAAEEDITSYNIYCEAVEARMKQLEKILHKHGIDFSTIASVTVERPRERPQESREKKKSGKENVEDTVQELNEIVGKVNVMSGGEMPSYGQQGNDGDKVLGQGQGEGNSGNIVI
ncbi:voltage-gated hydrogen channel 1 [Elysia marginata]|uniref:Voltage-gated hydrogen channel 1 n=1 Tax=Elysia marginata TaxID=1093978 RepID=A0AAV4JPA3_9GAST|nr:voltage-gated hydrogen channel 1 [Elysia marginata]